MSSDLCEMAVAVLARRPDLRADLDNFVSGTTDAELVARLGPGWIRRCVEQARRTRDIDDGVAQLVGLTVSWYSAEWRRFAELYLRLPSRR